MDGISITELQMVPEVSGKKPARKRRKKKQSARKPRAAKSKALPSPLEPGQTQSEPEANQGGGLFGFLKSKPEPSREVARVSGGSSGGSAASYSEPLSAEAERLLSAIPDVIGESDGAGALPGGEPIGEAPAASPGSALLGPEIVSADALAGILKGAFGWVAEWRKRDVYQLDDARAAALAGPWCPVVNSWWDRIAPAFLAQFSAANPGLVSAIIATAVIVGPMVGADLKETAKEKAAHRSMVRESTAHNDPAPAKPATAGGMFHSMGDAA